MRGLGVCLALLAGCYNPRVVPGAACNRDNSCPSGLECVDNVCALPGTPAADATLPVQPDAAILGVDAAPDAAIDTKFVAHWTLDSAPMNGAIDGTGRGHLASCVTTCPTLVAGKIGDGYRFDAM